MPRTEHKRRHINSHTNGTRHHAPQPQQPTHALRQQRRRKHQTTPPAFIWPFLTSTRTKCDTTKARGRANGVSWMSSGCHDNANGRTHPNTRTTSPSHVDEQHEMPVSVENAVAATRAGCWMTACEHRIHRALHHTVMPTIVHLQAGEKVAHRGVSATTRAACQHAS